MSTWSYGGRATQWNGICNYIDNKLYKETKRSPDELSKKTDELIKEFPSKCFYNALP